MRLLFASHSSGLLGAERSLLEIVTEAVRDGHDVHVVLPAPGPLRDRLRIAGASTHEVRTRAWMGRWHRGPIGLIRLVQSTSDVLRHIQLQRILQPDYVVTNSSVIPGPALAAKFLGTAHLWIIREALASNPQLKSAIPKTWISKIIASSSRDVGCVSQFVEEQVRHLSGERVNCFRLTPRPQALEAGPRALRRDLEASPRALCSSDELSVVIVGGLSVEKGQRHAIRALARVRGRGGVKLVVVGGGSRVQRTALFMLAARLRVRDVVTFAGSQPDVSKFYESSDVALMLSGNEAYGRVTVEALAHGLPVIAFDAGASREILRNGGGLLVPYGDHEALASVLTGLSQDRGALTVLADSAVEASKRLYELPTQWRSLAEVFSA